MSCLECLYRCSAEWQWAYCWKSFRIKCFYVENRDSNLGSYPCLSYWQTGILFWEMWAADEISVTVGKGWEYLLWVLSRLLCVPAEMWFCSGKCKNEVRHWLAVVIWVCYLEGGGTWARLCKSKGLNVSYDYKRICGHYTTNGEDSMSRGKKSPLLSL